MPWLLDALYLCALIVLSPYLLYRALRTGRYRRGLGAKLLGRSPCLSTCQPVWFHGVSVGEIHLLRQVVAALRRRRPDLTCVISTTTETGFDESRKAFPDLTVFFFPFDFSWAVRSALRRVHPALVVLAEGEIWPNFLLAARRRVPVVTINGRMSPRSFRRFRRLGGLARALFGLLERMLMQNEEYTGYLRQLGVPEERLRVTGSVKFDGVTADRHNPRTQVLRQLLDVRDDDLVWIAGSTQAPEEEIVVDIYRRLRSVHPRLRLFLVPRHPDRFGEVARLLERSGLPFERRSALRTPRSELVLIDTLGELGALWGLADVAFVGGSLDGRRGGQNMIEPAAYGAAVVFGPHVWNFRDVAARLVEAGGACQVADGDALEAEVSRLLGNPQERQSRGAAARQFVLQQQGATERTVDHLVEMLAEQRSGRRVA